MSLGLSLGHGSFTFLPHQKMKLGVKHSGKCSGGALLFCVGGWVNGVHEAKGLHSSIGHLSCKLESLHVYLLVSSLEMSNVLCDTSRRADMVP